MRLTYSWSKMAKLFANSGDPDQMPHSAASDQGLDCLPITFLRVSPTTMGYKYRDQSNSFADNRHNDNIIAADMALFFFSPKYWQFSYFSTNDMLWVLIRRTSVRHSNECPQHLFMKNKINITWIPLLSGAMTIHGLMEKINSGTP